MIWTLFVVLTWKYIGFAIILFLAGLQGVPDELERGRADRRRDLVADPAATSRIPLLGPTIRIWAFLSIIGSLQLFDVVWVLTGGGPVNATTTMATYMVQYGFQRSQLGFGSAVAVILFVISLVVRAALPALRAPPRPRGALTSEGELMADSAIRQARAARRRFDWGQPFVYVIALPVAGITIVPVLYVIISGFRTTAQLNADPAGLPDPWTIENYTACSASDGSGRRCSTARSSRSVPRSASVVLGVMAAFVIARYEFRGGTRCTRCSPPGCCSRSRSRSCRSTCCCRTSGCSARSPA